MRIKVLYSAVVENTIGCSSHQMTATEEWWQFFPWAFYPLPFEWITKWRVWIKPSRRKSFLPQNLRGQNIVLFTFCYLFKKWSSWKIKFRKHAQADAGTKSAFSYHLHSQLFSLLEVMKGRREKMENIWFFFTSFTLYQKKPEPKQNKKQKSTPQVLIISLESIQTYGLVSFWLLSWLLWLH